MSSFLKWHKCTAYFTNYSETTLLYHYGGRRWIKMTKTEIDLINEHHSDAVIETFDVRPAIWKDGDPIPQKVPLVLSEIIGEAVEYDPLTGTYKKKLQALVETDAPGSEYWNKMGNPIRTLTDEETK